jgi:predicted alpha/beta-fold hydrolase
VLRHAHAAGWRGVVLNFRSCSGEPNRLPRFYHSGDTGDLDLVVRRLLERDPGARLGLVGVSLGGNVLLKWLGEQGEGVPGQVLAASAISVPFDLEACARVMDRGFAKHVYTASFLRPMRRKVLHKARVFPGFVDVAAVRRARTFAAYDRAMTAPVHGFADELDYWRRASCAPYLGRIRPPTLLLSAQDDPFVPAAALPGRDTLPPQVRLEVTPRGGHVGFVDGRWPWRVESWAERRAVAFLAGLLA